MSLQPFNSNRLQYTKPLKINDFFFFSVLFSEVFRIVEKLCKSCLPRINTWQLVQEKRYE